MRVAIYPSGRVVVPKRFRDALGVGRGGHLEMELEGGEVRVRPIGFGHLVRDEFGLLVVAAAEGTVPAPLSTDHLRLLVEEARDSRGD